MNLEKIFTLVYLLCLLIPLQANINSFYGVGIQALSGDTFEISGPSPGEPHRLVKLFGVTAPQENEPYYLQAKTHLNNLISNKFLKIESIKTVTQKPSKSNLDIGMAIILEGGDLYKLYANDIALNLGFVKHNETETTGFDDISFNYANLEYQAKREEKGLWAPNPNSEEVEDKPNLDMFEQIAKNTTQTNAENQQTNQQATDSDNNGKVEKDKQSNSFERLREEAEKLVNSALKDLESSKRTQDEL